MSRRADRWNRITFYFSWEETPILHLRVSPRQVEIIIGDRRTIYPGKGEWAVIERYGPPPLDVTEALDGLWALHDAPDTEDSGQALWHVIEESEIARTNSDVAALVSRYHSEPRTLDEAK